MLHVGVAYIIKTLRENTKLSSSVKINSRFKLKRRSNLTCFTLIISAHIPTSHCWARAFTIEGQFTY